MGRFSARRMTTVLTGEDHIKKEKGRDKRREERWGGDIDKLKLV